jgi:hypothetical protein
MLHNYIISSIIPENCIPFRPAVTYGGVTRKQNFVVILPKFGHKTIRFYANEEINIQTNYTIFILLSKTPHRLRARGDNNNKKKKMKKKRKILSKNNSLPRR